MKKRAEILKALAAGGAVILLMTGCGSSAGDYKASRDTAATTEAAAYENAGGSVYLSDDIYSDAAWEEAAEIETEAGTADTGVETEDIEKAGRKLIKNVSLEVETRSFDELLRKVEEKAGSFAGYIEESYTYNGSSYYGGARRNASMTIRIPAENLDGFLSSVSEMSNIISRNDSVTDVTLQYVDLESHKEALLTEQTRLLELLEQAESVEDIITIESRLSEVRYQLESMESQLRTLDNQVSYSTVYLYVDEVESLTPVKEQSIGEKISTGFMQNLRGVGNDLADFGINFIINLPYLVLWAVILILAVLAVRAFIRLKKKRKLKKQEKKAAREQEKKALEDEKTQQQKEEK